MRTGVLFLSLILSFFFTSKTFACSCAYFANAQQAAQSKNVIIAKVETLTFSPEGKARVHIENVFKGKIENVYLDIQGQDGVNCNGENISQGHKGILLFQKTEEGYQTLSCATTNIPQNSSGLYQIFLGEEFILTEKELNDVLNYKLQPTVKSAECQISVDRMSVPYDRVTHMNFSYTTSVSATLHNDTTILTTTVDLSPLAPKVHELYFFGEIKKLENSNYEFNIHLKDPFTTTALEKQNIQLDLRKHLEFMGPSLSHFTDLAGNPMTDTNQPFLSHQTRAFCALNLGKPLEVVK